MKKKILVAFVCLSSLVWGQIQNPDNPAKGKWDFQAKKIWEIDAYGDIPLAGVQSIVLGNDGRTYIVDSKLQKIFILDPEGKLLKSFGKKGEGPGEIRNFRAGRQLFLLENHLLYRDTGRIHHFSADGDYQRSAVFSNTLQPQAFVSPDSFISAPERITDEKNKTTPIKWVNIKDNTEKTIAQYSPFAKASNDKESGGQRMRVMIIIGGVTPLMTVYHKNRKVYYGMSDSYQIFISDLEGNSEGKFSVEGRIPQKLSESFFSDLKARFGDIPADMSKRILDSLPRRAAFFKSIYVDNTGFIYVLRSNPNQPHLISMDIFSPKGNYLYQADLEMDVSQSVNNMSFNENFMTIAYQDEEGNLNVAKYAIKLPEK